VPNPQKRFLDKTRFPIHINEHAVGVVGGQDAIFSHVLPAEAEVVPLLGPAEGSENHVVVNGVVGVPRLGPEPVERPRRTLPRGRLLAEDDGDFFGRERGGVGK